MQYTQLDSTLKYDYLAETTYNRQLEHFQYNVVIQNLTEMLKLVTDDAQRQSLENQLAANQEQMAIVELHYQAAIAQIDDQAAYDAAVIRAAEKRNSISSNTTSTNVV
jgi:hypothetical protein